MVAPPSIASGTNWSPPPGNAVKINVDAHIMEGVGVNLGDVIRKNYGKLLVAGVKRVEADWEPEVAEAGATRFGVELAKKMGYDCVVLECDALRVVKAIKLQQVGRAPVFLLYQDIIGICNSFSQFLCLRVRRSGNTVAHCIARWDTSINSERICINSFPPKLTSFAGY